MEQTEGGDGVVLQLGLGVVEAGVGDGNVAEAGVGGCNGYEGLGGRRFPVKTLQSTNSCLLTKQE